MKDFLMKFVMRERKRVSFTLSNVKGVEPSIKKIGMLIQSTAPAMIEEQIDIYFNKCKM
jgi:hypothetical protein